MKKVIVSILLICMILLTSCKSNVNDTADKNKIRNVPKVDMRWIKNTENPSNDTLISITEEVEKMKLTKIPSYMNMTVRTKSIDSVKKSVTVKDYKTGYVTEMFVSERTNISIRHQLDIDELEEGTPVRYYFQKIDDGAKTLSGGLMSAMYVESHEKSYTDPEDLFQGNMVYGNICFESGDYQNEESDMLLSRDKTKKVQIDVGGEIYQIHSAEMARPLIYKETHNNPFEALKINCDSSVKASYDGETVVLENIYMEDNFEYLFPYWVNEPAGPSGLTMDDLAERLSNTNNKYNLLKPQIDQAVCVDFNLYPAMADVGETVTVTVIAKSATVPNDKLILTEEYLKNGSEKETITLKWEKSKTADAIGKYTYTASVVLPSEKLGMHLVTWDCGIAGSDISTFSRTYAIVNNDSVAFIINNLSCDGVKPDYDEKFIPYTTWESSPLDRLWGNISDANQWTSASLKYRQYGISPGYMLSYAPWGTYQLREETVEFQTKILEMNRDIANMLGFDTTAMNFGDYGMGVATVEAARELGYKYIHSYVTNNHVDGTFGINHASKPDRPFYISMDDFRKPKKEEKPIIGFSQLQWNYPLGLRYFSHFIPGAGEYCTVDYHSVQKLEDIDVYYSRVMDFLDALYQNRESQKSPYIIQMNLQFQYNDASVNDCNRNMLAYYIEKAKTDATVIVTANAVADYYLNHVIEHPETTMYLQDNFIGFSSYDKPVNHPDVMSMENEEFMTVNFKGSMLPDTCFDYTTDWDYPDCGNEQIPRSKSGLGQIVDEDNIYKYEITPLIVDTRNMNVSRSDFSTESGKLKLEITVMSDRDQAHLPISLWDIPCDFSSDDGWFYVSDTTEGGFESESARFVAVKAPYSGALNGFLIADIKEGENKFYIIFNKDAIDEIPTIDFTIDNCVSGKVFTRNGLPMAYLCNDFPWSTNITITLPAGKTARAFVSPRSELVELTAGVNELYLPVNQQLHIIGLTLDELVDMMNAECDG